MNHSDRFTIKLAYLITLLAWLCLGTPLWVLGQQPTLGQQPIAPSDQFTAPTPVMTFMDMNTGQPWGRYVISETVTVPKYEYQEVKERVWVPTWVQEPRATTATQYEQVVSYQLRPRSVPSWNPLVPPQQILEYAPIVQYQPRNVQAMQMTTYQKYEEREITRMVPVLVNASEQRAKFVDRPLTSPPSAGPMASNLVQESAMVAQASRTSARYPTRSIDYPSANYGSPTYAYTSPTVAWSAPRTLVPSPTTTVANSGVPATNASYSYAASPPANTMPTSVGAPPNSIIVGNGTVYSSALVPVPSALVASNPMATPTIPAPMNNTFGYPANPNYPYAYAPYGSAPTAYPPYAAYPYGANPYASWMTSTGTLFSTNMFQTQSTAPVANTAMVPNNPAYASNAPNFWGRSAPTTMPPTFGTYPPTVNASGTTGYR
ncbi:MAG: hypothetical protein KGQ51_14150 [Planctomycetes bacterium]|nr:hypothetical protein [Planctomycetota bacterium]